MPAVGSEETSSERRGLECRGIGSFLYPRRPSQEREGLVYHA